MSCLHSTGLKAFTLQHIALCYACCNNVKLFIVRWAYKAKRRHAPGTGRLRHVKVVNRRFQ